MPDRELRYGDRRADPASMTEEQIRAELKYLSGSDACGFPQWEIEARKWRLEFEIEFRQRRGG